MGASETLEVIFQALSRQSANVEDKMARLRQASRKLSQEEHADLQAIRYLTQPGLGADWMGPRARVFQKNRECADQQMKGILTADLEDYRQRIEAKINDLRLESDFLRATGALADEAESLLHQGEKAAEALSRRLTQIKGRLF